MSAPPNPSARSASFVPQELVSVQCGSKLQLMLYPAVVANMPVQERCLAFQICKTTLTTAAVLPSIKLDVLGRQLNSSTTVEGTMQDFRSRFDDSWCTLAELSILSFHNSAGNVINDTTDAANPSILLPIQDGPLNQCRSADVRFVRVTNTLDMNQLITLDPPGTNTLRVSYYIELPQGTRAMTNAAGNAYNLTTYLGPDDLTTLDRDTITADILSHTLQTGPMNLVPGAFNLADCGTDTIEIAQEIEKRLFAIAWDQILRNVFVELCPGYTDQPHAAVENIKQEFIDTDGNLVVSPVVVYYQRMMVAARPFGTMHTWPVDLCNKYINGLSEHLLPAFRRHYHRHDEQHDRTATHQRQQLSAILRAAQMAEDEVKSIQKIAASSIHGSQAFLTNPASPNAVSFPSQAETTLRGYDSSASVSTAGSTSTRNGCFGCGQTTHTWYDTNTKQIVCPNRNLPGVMQNAERERAAYIERMKKKRDKRKRKQSSPSKLMASIEKMDDADRSKLRRVLFTSATDELSVASSVTSPTVATAGTGSGTALVSRYTSAGASSGKNKALIFVIDVQVFSSASLSRPVIPASISCELPHIELQLGSELNGSNTPSVRVVVDTAAGITVGNFYYWAMIAKTFPHCLSKVFAPQDYSPIRLTGIVQRGGEGVSTELDTAFLFQLPYLTRDGQTTSFLVSVGPHVTVNAIIGIPFIKSTGMVIDTPDQVAELRALDASPFPISYRRAAVHVPIIDESAVSINYAQYQDTIEEIENLERHVAAVYSAQTTSSPSHERRVHFGSANPRLGRVGGSTAVVETAIDIDSDGIPEVNAAPSTVSVPNDWNNLVDAAQQYHNVSARVNSQDAISENLDPMVWEGQADSL